MANLNLPPPPQIPLGTAEVGGKTVNVTLNPEWARYFDSLNKRVNVTTATISYPSMAGAGLALNGGDDGGSADLIPGPRGNDGRDGAVIGLMYADESPTEVMSRPASSAADVGLANVTNDTQTKAAIVPNTAPSAGQILVGNAGGTAYAPVSASGAFTLASTGAATIATPGTLTVASTNSTATAHTHAITSSSAPGAAASILATDASGHVGATGARIVKGWFIDLTVTNAIAASVTGNAATVTTNANLTGVITSSGNATSIASQTGTGTKFVVDTSPVLVTPNIGTPSAGTLTNCTGLPQAGVSNSATTSFTATATGMTTSPTGSAQYSVIGNLCVLNIPGISGTSNATTFTFTGMPAAARPTSTRSVVVRVQDNGSGYLTGLAQIASTGVISFFKDLSGTAFTAAGTKSTGDMCVAYPLQ